MRRWVLDEGRSAARFCGDDDDWIITKRGGRKGQKRRGENVPSPAQLVSWIGGWRCIQGWLGADWRELVRMSYEYSTLETCLKDGSLCRQAAAGPCDDDRLCRAVRLARRSGPSCWGCTAAAITSCTSIPLRRAFMADRQEWGEVNSGGPLIDDGSKWPCPMYSGDL